ncbi:hypothetical protein INR49_000518 [Caranx melampygus]|nr:hypothetical protein INR49_000518 [Caranx melampygus]
MRGACTLLVFCVASVTVWVVTADAKELSITTIKQDPYTMRKGSELEGYCIDLISELSKMLGFSYKLHLVKDNRYGALDSSGTWNGMIGEVIRGEADLAVAPLTLTAVREQYVDMTTPFMQTGIGFILRKDLASEESTFSLLAPFSTEMWIGILIAFLLTGVCIFLVGRISPTEWAEPDSEEHNFTLQHSFWYITGALTLQGAGPHPKALSGRLVSAIWWLFVIMLLACYFGNFNAMLHSNSNVSIKTFEDLANQDVIDYGTVEGSPLVKNLTVAILKLSESGELTYLRDKWWASSCMGDNEDQASGGLQPKDLRGLFLLLGLGLSVGLLLALLELVSRAHNQAKDGKRSCCSVLTAELNQRFGSRGETTEQDSSEKSKA